MTEVFAEDPTPDRHRGRLRIYLGAAPGVGKTYAMLGEGHRRLSRGTDVVIGFVEDHGRAQTATMAEGMETVPRRQLLHRGSEFGEMDTRAVIARRPQVVLIDELAHTNVPGSEHEKRWQDIDDVLDAGIDVISTVNIQHLESVNDVVEAITGIKQRETVPDAVVRAADQIELVDMSPQALRRRMAHGNVYAPEKVDAALGNYFRVGNLTALRELALLWVADRVEEGLDQYREQHGIQETWAARQRIVVAVTGGKESETLLRRGAVIAGRSAGRDLMALHVIRSDGTRGAAPQGLARLRQLTADLGGTFHTVVGDDVPRAVLGFARSVNGTQVVIGASRRGRLSHALFPTHSDLIVKDSDEIDVHVVMHEHVGSGIRQPQRRIADRRRRIAWAAALVIPALVTLLLLPLAGSVSLTTVVLAYVLGVVGTALIGGLAPAILTSLVAALAANWFFTPPVGTFTINEPENAFALVVMVAVGAIVATIVDRSAARAQQATRSQAEANVLAAMSTGVLTRVDGVRGLLDQARETFTMTGATLFERSDPKEAARAVEVSGVDPPQSPAEADVVVDAGPNLTLALTGHPLRSSDLRLLDAFARQSGAVLERNRLAARAADAQRLREAEAMRTSILAAVSHDLRTPLAGIEAALETLGNPAIKLSAADRAALLHDAQESADRLEVMLLNLLDLSRLQTGTVKPQMDDVSLDEIVQRALQGIPAAKVADETEDGLPLIRTDAGLLERVVANLLSNAVRHSPTDTPVRLSAGAIPGGQMQLRIADCGKGIAERDKDLVFRAFQRLGDAPEGTGVGLGLAVARGLSDAIGASVEAEDTPGGGLTMVVTVPLAGSDHMPAASQEVDTGVPE
jgi:two-component system, OmpR family, sensor histidine kinase KdpD